MNVLCGKASFTALKLSVISLFLVGYLVNGDWPCAKPQPGGLGGLILEFFVHWVDLSEKAKRASASAR